MSIKLVVGILLVVSILLVGPAQADCVGPSCYILFESGTPTSTDSQIVVDIPALSAARAFAFDIDDIDSPDIQSVQATTDYAATLAAPFVPGGAIVSAEELKTEVVNEGFVIFVPQ